MKDTKILLVGGAGYIGTHLVFECLNAGYQVRVLDNFSSSTPEHLPPAVEVIEGDICQKSSVLQALAGNVGAVIHLAALKSVGNSMLNPGAYATQNIGGAIQLLNAMAKLGVKNLVFSSSAAVYGTPEYTPVDEQHPTQPTSFYGFTKLEVERLLYWYSQLLGLNYVSLRYFNVAGYSKPVQSLEQKPNNLLPIIMEVLLKQRPQLEVYGSDYNTQDGTCIRDYIHIQDLCSAHLLAVERLLSQGAAEVFNLGTGKGFSVKEVVLAVEKLVGHTLPVKQVDRRLGDPAILTASSSKAEKILGWQAKHSSLESIVASMLQAYGL